jgi:hypothetical protein
MFGPDGKKHNTGERIILKQILREISCEDIN